MDDYRTEVLIRVPQLDTLDKEDFSSEDKQDALAAYEERKEELELEDSIPDEPVIYPRASTPSAPRINLPPRGPAPPSIAHTNPSCLSFPPLHSLFCFPPFFFSLFIASSQKFSHGVFRSTPSSTARSRRSKTHVNAC